MTHIMVDLETFGKKPGSAIVALGAAAFDPHGEVLDTFYCNIDLESCLARGLTMDGDTVMWWMHPDRDEARKALMDRREDLGDVLDGFSMWALTAGGIRTTPDKVQVWGNGATFDNVLLDVAFTKVGLERPWSYKGDRCYRTIRALAPEVEFVKHGVHHNALDDAVGQARHLQAIVAALGLKL